MHIAFIHGNDGSDVRVSKMCRSLIKLGHRVTLIGWDRRPELNRPVDLGPTRREILVLPTRSGRVSVGGELRFCAHVQRTLARVRPDAVHSVNEDNTLLALPLKGVAYGHLVCDLFDALGDRVSAAHVFSRGLLRCAGNVAREVADRLIVTDMQRWQRLGVYRRKATVIMNVPEDPGPDYAARVPVGPVKVLVSGVISRTRGLAQITQVAERLSHVEIVAAGWLFDEYAKEVFVRHPRVSFRGAISPQQALVLAAECDAILALYEPSITLHIFASPNKIYDALAVGRPVIVNSEAIVSRWVEENGVGVRCPYHDVDALTAIVASLAARRASLAEFARRARGLYVQGYSWEKMIERLDRLYAGLTSRS